MDTVQYMATYGVAHVHRSSLNYQIYHPVAPRGLASIPVSTYIGFRALLCSYLWYVYTDILSIVLMQTTAETETHHCRTNRPRPLSGSISNHKVSPVLDSPRLFQLNNSSSRRINLCRSSGLHSPSRLGHPLPTPRIYLLWRRCCYDTISMIQGWYG